MYLTSNVETLVLLNSTDIAFKSWAKLSISIDVIYIRKYFDIFIGCRFYLLTAAWYFVLNQKF